MVTLTSLNGAATGRITMIRVSKEQEPAQSVPDAPKVQLAAEPAEESQRPLYVQLPESVYLPVQSWTVERVVAPARVQLAETSPEPQGDLLIVVDEPSPPAARSEPPVLATGVSGTIARDTQVIDEAGQTVPLGERNSTTSVEGIVSAVAGAGKLDLGAFAVTGMSTTLYRVPPRLSLSGAGLEHDVVAQALALIRVFNDDDPI